MAIILYSNCGFPVSAVAGAILTGRLSERYAPGKIWEVVSESNPGDYSEGRVIILGQAPGGEKVAAFTARSGKIILKNIICSFLQIHGLDKNSHRIVEVKTPRGILLLLGQAFLGLPLISGAGRSLLEKYIEGVYPGLVNTIKLDCNFQISDN